MSDPAHGGYECHGPMVPVELPEICEGTAAFLCVECLKWRHALRLFDARRRDVVAAMENQTRDIFEKREHGNPIC